MLHFRVPNTLKISDSTKNDDFYFQIISILIFQCDLVVNALQQTRDVIFLASLQVCKIADMTELEVEQRHISNCILKSLLAHFSQCACER